MDLSVHFLKYVIVVSGFDVKINLPVVYGTSIYNDSGFYSYNDLDSYFIFSDHVELFLILEKGVLAFDTNNELNRKILGLLQQNKIKLRKNL